MKKFYVFIIFLISVLLFSGCGSPYNSSGPDSVQISLPYEDGCIDDMEIDENGNLRVAMYEIDQDGKKAKATCWITRDDGKSWENLYEEYFEANDKKEETVEIAPCIAGDGLFILKYNYKGDSFEVNSEELYYIKDLNIMPQYNNYKNKNIPILYIFAVAPYTGAWIEITFDLFRVLLLDGRTLHGCVY